MNISSLPGGAGTAGGRAPARSARSATVVPVPDSVSLGTKQQLLDAIVDGSSLQAKEKEQIYSELSGIPSQIWRILGQGGLRIVTVNEGRDLSQTEAVDNFAFDDYEERVAQAHQWFEQTVAQVAGVPPQSELGRALWEYQQGEIIARQLIQDPLCAKLGFEVAVAGEAVELVTLANGQDPERYAADLTALNGSRVTVNNGLVDALYDVLLLPYPRVDGKPIRPDHLQYMQTQDSAMLRAGMGTHYWQSAVVVVHQRYLPDPAPEAGHHRVLVHEVGHAIDHVLERIRNDGYGDQHRATVDRMFAQDSALAASGVQRFSSPRAKDNAREYFAEAVEACMTRSHGDAHETKPNNHREWLKQHNPELHDYVADVFARTYPEQLDLKPLPAEPNYKPPLDFMHVFDKPYKVF